jgi:hypothetical protein
MTLIDKYFARILFLLAGLTLLLAFAEAFAQLFGTSLVAGTYSAGRLLELSAVLMVFVIAQLLRQIREALGVQSKSNL